MKLTELLARNTHEVWAQQRLAEGWTFGASRDDAAKKHPCLDLPESAFRDPRLRAICSNCGNPLQFNPFVVEK